MTIKQVGLPFDTDTPIQASFAETAVLSERLGNVVAVQRYRPNGFTEAIDYTVFSPDGEVLSQRRLDVDMFGDRISDIAVRPDGSMVVLYRNAFGNRHVQLLDEDGKPLTKPVLVWKDGGLASHIDVAADGSFTFTAVTAGATGYNGGTVLARFDAKGKQIGKTDFYYDYKYEDSNGKNWDFAGQHDTLDDGTLVIARTETYTLPHPTSDKTGRASGVSVDLVSGGAVTNIDLHVPRYVLHDTVPPTYQIADTTDVGNPPQAAVLDTGGLAVSYRVNVGVGNGSVPTQFIRFLDDDGGNATDPYALFSETDESATVAAGEFWLLPVAGGKVAIVWTHTVDKTLHVEFVWRDKKGAVVSEEAQIGTARGVGSAGSGTGIFSVNAAPDGSVYITVQQADPDAYVTLRVMQGADGALSVRTGSDKADKINGSKKADLIDAEGGRDTVNGKDGDDTIWGGSGNDVLKGAKGDDALYGGTGNDMLSGGGGKDMLDGGDGNDVLIGGPGADALIGGDGKDTASYEDARKSVTANLKNAGQNKGDAAGDSYKSVENLTGGRKGDTLTGNDGANVLEGMGGADKLSGGKGNDVLAGGAGKDTLTGGPGKDQFVFRALSDSPAKKKGWDVITDFRHKQGDRIDLKAIDAKAGTKKDDAFTFIGKDAFSGKKGELRFDGNNKKTFVYGDVNGDKVADFRIELTGKIDLAKDDFVL